jgi:hypothetical protein
VIIDGGGGGIVCCSIHGSLYNTQGNPGSFMADESLTKACEGGNTDIEVNTQSLLQSGQLSYATENSDNNNGPTEHNNNNGLTQALGGVWSMIVSGEWHGTDEDLSDGYDSDDSCIYMSGSDSDCQAEDATEDEPSQPPGAAMLTDDAMPTDDTMPTDACAEILAGTRNLDTRRDIVVTIRQPQPGTMCPISLDTIDDSVVTGFEGFAVNPDCPELTEIVLQCQHSFSASYLLVSWLTTSMRCPLCRSGLDTKLCPLSMPSMWQQPAIEHVKRIANAEKLQQLAEDREEALRIGLTYPMNVQLYMCIYIIDHDGSVQSTVVQFSQNAVVAPEAPEDPLTLTVTRAHVRVVSALVRSKNCVAVDMVVFARIESDGVDLLEIANSGLVDMPTRLDDGTEEPPLIHPHPVRNFVCTKPSVQRDIAAPDASQNVFSMVWQQHPNPTMDTLTEITFTMPFINLAMTVSGLFTGPPSQAVSPSQSIA